MDGCLCRHGGGSRHFPLLAWCVWQASVLHATWLLLPHSGPPLAPTAKFGHLLLPQGLLASFVDPAASCLTLGPFQGGFWAQSWQAARVPILSGAGTRPVWLQCLTLLQSQHRLHERGLWGFVGAVSFGGNEVSKGLHGCGLLR